QPGRRREHALRPAALRAVFRTPREGFHHAQVEGKLDESEMVFRPAFFGADFRELWQAERALLEKAIPGGDAIAADPELFHQPLQTGEGPPDAALKHVARHEAELGFRVVEIEHVDGVHAQVGPAALDLIGQKLRRYAMHAARDLVLLENHWHGARYQEPGLGADHNLIPLEPLQRGADATLGTLVAVVDGGVEEIDAAFAGCDQGVRVGPVGSLVVTTQVSAD